MSTLTSSSIAAVKKVLVVDVGGTHVKLLASGQSAVTKLDSGPDLTPQLMMNAVKEATATWDFNLVAIGFPSPVVHVMQQDALERFGLKQMLAEPEMLEAVLPDVNLVATLMTLSGVLPKKSRETARMVIRKVVDELMRKLNSPKSPRVPNKTPCSSRLKKPCALSSISVAPLMTQYSRNKSSA